MADFAKGSIIVCPDCLKPIYALERGLGPMDRAGRAASAFRPITCRDIADLQRPRPDVPAGWQAVVKAWAHSAEFVYVLAAERPKAGDEAICPNCGGYWLTFADREYGSACDRGYELQLIDIPPDPVAAHQLAARRKWLLPDADAPGVSEPVVIRDNGVPIAHD